MLIGIMLYYHCLLNNVFFGKTNPCAGHLIGIYEYGFNFAEIFV